MEELSKVIAETLADLVLLGTQTDVSRYLDVDKPVYRVKQELQELNVGELEEAIFDKIDL